jgi:hypothetical protein
MNLQSRYLYIQKQQEELKAMRERTPLEQQEFANELTEAYVTNYQQVQTALDEFGNDPHLLEARRHAEQKVRASLTVPLNVAMGAQHSGSRGSGEVAKASVETANMILENEGIADKDVQQRIARMVLQNGAISRGVEVPRMNVAKQSFNLTKDFYEIDDDTAVEQLSGVEIKETAKLKGQLSRVLDTASRTFDRIASTSNISPDERLTWALSEALEETGITKEATPQETFYITHSVMETLERKQDMRMRRGLAQLPALSRKYEEDAAVVLLDYLRTSKEQGKLVTYTQLMESVGENEMLNALGNTEALPRAYMKIRKQMADLNQNYENLSEGDRFSMFVSAYADYAARNVNSGSAIRDQYQIQGLQRISEAAGAGILQSKFGGLAAPLQEIWRDYESQHNEVVIARNETIRLREQSGLASTVAPDGKVASWKPVNELYRSERMAKLIGDPAVWELFKGSDRISTDKQGNYILNVGDIDVFSLQKYAEAMNLGGEWTRMAIEPAVGDRPAITMNSFSDEGKMNWQNTMNVLTQEIVGNPKFFTPTGEDAPNAVKHLRGLAGQETGMFKKKLNLGDIIADDPMLFTALRQGHNNPYQVQAVLNAALVKKYAAVEDAVMHTLGARAEADVRKDILSVLPAEVQAGVEEDFKRGDLTTLWQQLPAMESRINELKDEFTSYYDSLGETRPDLISNPLQRFAAMRRHSEEVEAGMERAVDLASDWNVERQKALLASKKLNNYLKLIDKQGEVEAFTKYLGMPPPRAWAFIGDATALADELERIASTDLEQ